MCQNVGRLTCVARSAHFRLGEAVFLIFGVAKVTNFEQSSPIAIQQGILQLDVSIDYSHLAKEGCLR